MFSSCPLVGLHTAHCIADTLGHMVTLARGARDGTIHMVGVGLLRVRVEWLHKGPYLTCTQFVLQSET